MMDLYVKYYELSRTLHVDGVTPETWHQVRVPADTRRMVISGDYLDELVIPEGVKSVVCHGLGLRKLTVPASVEYLFCNRNCLRNLEVPHTIYMLDISYNPLYALTFRGCARDEELVLGRIQMNKVKMTSFTAKVKDVCEIDLSDNPQLVDISPEVERSISLYPYRGEEYVDDGRF